LSISARFDLANRGVPHTFYATFQHRKLVQPHTFYATLLILAQRDFAGANCSDAEMSVFQSPVFTRSQIFSQLWTAAVSQRWVYFPPIS